MVCFRVSRIETTVICFFFVLWVGFWGGEGFGKFDRGGELGKGWGGVGFFLLLN